MTRKHARAASLAVALAIALAAPAAAWKPKTHVYLAERALDEVLAPPAELTALGAQPGQVWVKNLATGAWLLAGTIDPSLADGLERFRPQYLAGVIGPDAYPDLATGQINIHPHVSDARDGSESGTDAFLQHVWDSAERACFCYRRKARVFTRGYLTHAAGDMFAHTFVNHYAGGEFAILPDPEQPDAPNAVRHLVLEGYVGRRTPTTGGVLASPDGLEEWIHQTLVDARPGSALADLFVYDDPARLNVRAAVLIPRVYSGVRAAVQAQLDQWATLPEGPPKELLGVGVPYLEDWVRAIDRGLEEWVTVSAQVSDLILFTPQDAGRPGPGPGERDGFRAVEKLLERYRVRHLDAMSGEPGAYHLYGVAVYELGEALAGPYDEAMRRLRTAILDAIVAGVYGGSMTWQRFADIQTNPGNFFDGIYRGRGCPIQQTTLADFNERELGLPRGAGAGGPGQIDFREIPAAYNTYVMSKLILLEPADVANLVRALAEPGSEPQGLDAWDADNVMLGFLQSIDASRQWKQGAELGDKESDVRELAFERFGVYDKLFMRQTGDHLPDPEGASPDDCPGVAK